MLGESWALFVSNPHKEVDSIACGHSFTHALSLSVNVPLPTSPSPHGLCALDGERKETPLGSGICG